MSFDPETGDPVYRCPDDQHLMSAEGAAAHGSGSNNVDEKAWDGKPPDGQEGGMEDEPGQIKTSTVDLLTKASEEFGPSELQDTLDHAPNLVQFNDLDRAMQVAIDTIVRSVAEGQPEEVRRYCGSTLMTGYLVGRAMLDTAGGALHYSNPLTEADNVDTLVKLSTTTEAEPYASRLGPTGKLFMDFQIEMANRAGPLSSLPEDERGRLTGGPAAIGMVLAIAEHDLFAAS